MLEMFEKMKQFMLFNNGEYATQNGYALLKHDMEVELALGAEQDELIELAEYRMDEIEDVLTYAERTFMDDLEEVLDNEETTPKELTDAIKNSLTDLKSEVRRAMKVTY